MTTADPDRILDEFKQLRADDEDPGLAAIRWALVVEDVFGITLSDDQIDRVALGEPAALRGLLASSTPS